MDGDAVPPKGRGRRGNLGFPTGKLILILISYYKSYNNIRYSYIFIFYTLFYYTL